MTHRERTLATLNYQLYDRLPLVHFGYWRETLLKWAAEGHISAALAQEWNDGNQCDLELNALLGFDLCWMCVLGARTALQPGFTERVIERFPDGSYTQFMADGVIVVAKPGVVSIPAEIDHLLKDRATWEEHYQPRLQFSLERMPANLADPALRQPAREFPRGLFCGSLFGVIRNWLGVEGSSYLYADDEPLFTEIIDTVGELCFRCAQYVLAQGTQFDFLHFWEDICFKNGPLVIPSVFAEKVGPHYKRITDLGRQHGITLCSLDCDGMIDALIPTWLSNGVNVMFPIEVGTWDASIAPWRATYGKELRGVGGMNKTVFAHDRAAIDREVARLKTLVDLGGFIPCPDHRIAPDAIWDNVRYYCQRMREVFG